MPDPTTTPAPDLGTAIGAVLQTLPVKQDSTRSRYADYALFAVAIHTVLSAMGFNLPGMLARTLGQNAPAPAAQVAPAAR